ncbi:MAG: hypothetical protein PHY29_02790 [Syntrophales bacterium]|nr:hypothetical protein [Syntrophales bacterium]
MFNHFYGIEIAIGQIWKDLDKRVPERYLKIIEIDEERQRVRMQRVRSNGLPCPFVGATWIAAKRLRKNATGYEPVGGEKET